MTRRATGLDFLRSLVAALDLPSGTEKVVIEASVRGPVRVYVKGLMPNAAIPDVVEAVADVSVRDDATVDVVPLPCGPDTNYADFWAARGVPDPFPDIAAAFKAVEAGTMTVNEARATIGLPPVPDAPHVVAGGT